MRRKIIGLVFLGIVVACLVFGVVSWLRPAPGRTNLLFLGIAGNGYSGSDLTDTIMVASINNQTGKTLLISLPRDIWIAELRTKLNSVYHYRGLGVTEEVIGEILGLRLDYGAMVDFGVFTKIIDALGGVEVTVERTFDDYKYPIAGKENDSCNGDKEYKCRYQQIHFEAGRQIMNGETALKFVRSRNAEGEEGTDFARAQRQQRLILAVKNRILSPGYLRDPRNIIRLYRVCTANIQTDIPGGKYLELLKITLGFRTKNLILEVVDERFLFNPPTSKEKYDLQWVLVPKSGSWQGLQDFIKSAF